MAVGGLTTPLPPLLSTSSSSRLFCRRRGRWGRSKSRLALNASLWGKKEVEKKGKQGEGRRVFLSFSLSVASLALQGAQKGSEAMQAGGGGGGEGGRTVVSTCEKLLRFASTEPDYEARMEYAEGAITAADAENRNDLKARALLLMGSTILLQREVDERVEKAAEFYRRARDAVRNRGCVEEVLAWDSLGLCSLQGEKTKEEYAESNLAFSQALGLAITDGVGETDVPSELVVGAGLRGAAPSILQRITLHKAFAMAATGQLESAVDALEVMDIGPNPDGFPQFWEARAARVASLWLAGKRSKAEDEWSSLCRPAPAPPPSIPTNKLYAGVNKAAQALLKAESVFIDKSCEDYSTGVFLPCDDAGIPGLGGSSSPCQIFTVEEAKLRLWPTIMIEGLDAFLSKR